MVRLRHLQGDLTSDIRQSILMLIQQALAAASLDADDRSAAQSGLLPLMDDLAYRYYLAADGNVFVRDALVPRRWSPADDGRGAAACRLPHSRGGMARARGAHTHTSGRVY